MKIRYTDDNGNVKWIDNSFVYYKYINGKWVVQKKSIKQKNKNKWVDK